MTTPDFAPALANALSRAVPNLNGLTPLMRLSGGASQETWAFDAISGGMPIPLILRRAPGGMRRQVSATSPGLAVEAAAIAAAREAGAAAPEVVLVLTDEDGAGDGYVMKRLEGETIARKILRDAAFAEARPVLARQCGEALARIHRADPAKVPGLSVSAGAAQLKHYRDLYIQYDHPHPMFDYAFKWLESRIGAPRRLALVHGDFRHGNLMIGPEGLRAALDWELVHIGDPLEDLSWLCVNSWRFGVTEKTVGGFGDVADLLAGYRDAGGDPYTEDDVHVWTVFGTVKWGVMCMSMYQAFAHSADRSVERAAIGRRSSETEIDLVNLLLGGPRP